MSERMKKFVEELDKLISEGDLLHVALQRECYGKDFETQVTRTFTDKAMAKQFLEALPNFRKDYQAWYSKAQAVVRQVLPNRIKDFDSYFEYHKPRKSITFDNYMVRDYL
jgi:hypothetical protein